MNIPKWKFLYVGDISDLDKETVLCGFISYWDNFIGCEPHAMRVIDKKINKENWFQFELDSNLFDVHEDQLCNFMIGYTAHNRKSFLADHCNIRLGNKNYVFTKCDTYWFWKPI